ncbi:hypothetical protein MNBD_GAMMA13-1991 [hydrothermal vent metagenome]|uniref:Uncharacterized protein n=1 Tax=hydrothermal vent metagenome TaxID=652676 RepID=A0A3B0Y9R9_9ZZZZ
MEVEAGMPIKIAAVGMDERSIARMTTLFKMVYKGRCEFTLGVDAVLGIVDLDGEPNIWNKFQRQYPGLPAIVMSESPASIEGAVHVTKPTKLDILWDAIFSLAIGFPSGAKAADKPTASTAAAAMDTQFDTADSRSKSVARSAQGKTAHVYNPDDYLLGRILSTLKDSVGKQCAIYVQCGEDQQLILLPDQGLAHTNLTDSQLRNFGVVTLKGKFTIDVNSVRGAGKKPLSTDATAGLRSLAIDHLVWHLALHTARGRVPEGTDVSKRLYLQCWPNFPRLPRTPHGMRIASLWVDNPRSLNDVAAKLGIERTDVYSFYSAAAAIGLAGCARRRVDGLIAPRDITEKDTHKRGLLASILRHLSQ